MSANHNKKRKKGGALRVGFLLNLLECGLNEIRKEGQVDEDEEAMLAASVQVNQIKKNEEKEERFWRRIQ